MGTCRYCQQPAGLLRSSHPECEVRHSGYLKRIAAELERAVHDRPGTDTIERIQEFATSGRIPESEVRAAMVAVWESAVDRYLQDGCLEQAEEERLQAYMAHFGLGQTDLDKRGALSRLGKAGTIRDVLEGKVPQRFQVAKPLPLNFLKDESVIWAFEGAAYLEDKTRTVRVGTSQGGSVRVMKGVYYRAGVFRSEAQQSTVREHVDTGLTVITDQNIYFTGPRKSVRVPFAKVIAFEPYSNGLGVVRDAPNAKTQVFVTGDGWFTYNLVTNLAKRSNV